jgi:hypothetical protein
MMLTILDLPRVQAVGLKMSERSHDLGCIDERDSDEGSSDVDEMHWLESVAASRETADLQVRTLPGTETIAIVPKHSTLGEFSPATMGSCLWVLGLVQVLRTIYLSSWDERSRSKGLLMNPT